MAQSSFPIVDRPLSDMQWGQVTEGFGSGILARRSEPYGFPTGSIDNASNTIHIGGRSPVTGDGRAVVSGFFHRYDENEVFSFPAVTTTTTYFFGLTYDPTQHAAPGGPVSLTVTTERPDGSGKVYLPIYEVTRRPNELLSDATIVDHRSFIAPTITVQGSRALPPVDSVLTYTVATDWETGQQWQMQIDGQWDPIGARTERLRSPGSWDAEGTIVAQPLADGRTQYTMDIYMTRSVSTPYIQGTEFSSRGTVLPESLRAPGRGVVYVPAMIGTQSGVIALDLATGELLSRVYSGTTTLALGSRLSGVAIWVA